jgi:hypothetical protein
MEWEEIYALLMLQNGGTGRTSRFCQSTREHPRIVQLAAKYQVNYEDILELYCQGYTFGNIDLAYTLSKDYKKDIKEILLQYNIYKNWGQLKKELNAQSANEGDGVNPNKPPTKEPNENKPPTKEANPNKGGEENPSKEANPTKEDK